MLRRLPFIFGIAAAVTVVLLAGPVAIAVALLRSSPEAKGPDLAAQIFLAALVLAAAALAGFAIWGFTRLLVRLARRDR